MSVKKEYYTVNEAATILGVSTQTIRTWYKRYNKIKVVRFNDKGGVRIHYTELQRLGATLEERAGKVNE